MFTEICTKENVDNSCRVVMSGHPATCGTSHQVQSVVYKGGKTGDPLPIGIRIIECLQEQFKKCTH